MIDDQITVLVPTSPIPSHPSTLVIEKTLTSVRKHLPVANIYIMVDGVREEQSHYRDKYLEYRKELVRKMLFNWENIYIFPFPEFWHQAAMTRAALEMVETPLILFMEHDTFFLDDLKIDWDGIARVIRSGVLNQVQFHCQWEPWIIPEHEHMMIDKERHLIDGVPFVRTFQFSARPHVACAYFYRRMLRGFFSQNCRTFIEDRMSEIIAASRVALGDEEAWSDWKLAYYAPEGSIRRTWTEDGRAGDPKFPLRY